LGSFTGLAALIENLLQGLKIFSGSLVFAVVATTTVPKDPIDNHRPILSHKIINLFINALSTFLRRKVQQISGWGKYSIWV